jgi:acetamidase/formamidase
LQSLARSHDTDDCNLLESRLLMATHEIPLDEATVHGYFSRELAPVLTIDAGDSVRFQSLNAGWRWEPDAELFDRDTELHGGHALSGPIEVRGARAGQTLVVAIDEVTPRGWGITVGDGAAFEWLLDGDVWRQDELRVMPAPFLGVIGMPPAEPGDHSTTPPRRFGGNIDCKLLVAGTTLYLPIPVDGALVSAGDGHGAQGDGEASGTAIECPLERVQLTIGVRDDLDLRMPIARTANEWVTFGFDEDLDVAAEHAVETMLDLLERERGFARKRALALASVCVDLRVTQVVNQAKGVHAVLHDDAIR